MIFTSTLNFTNIVVRLVVPIFYTVVLSDMGSITGQVRNYEYPILQLSYEVNYGTSGIILYIYNNT